MKGEAAMSLPHIRTMKYAYEELKEADPKTAITFYGFRRTVLSGKIPSFKEGQKILLNMDDVFKYYSNFTIETAPETGLQGQIRAIPE
jgi:hypothetical protein